MFVYFLVFMLFMFIESQVCSCGLLGFHLECLGLEKPYFDIEAGYITNQTILAYQETDPKRPSP